jgi:hypothetical protein
MGDWGVKNFQNDDGLDALGYICSHIIDSIREDLDDMKSDNPYKYTSDALVAKVDALSTLVDHYEFEPILQLNEIETWKREYLSLYDAYTKRRFSKPENQIEDHITYFRERRKVISDTFDHLYKALVDVGHED